MESVTTTFPFWLNNQGDQYKKHFLEETDKGQVV